MFPKKNFLVHSHRDAVSDDEDDDDGKGYRNHDHFLILPASFTFRHVPFIALREFLQQPETRPPPHCFDQASKHSKWGKMTEKISSAHLISFLPGCSTRLFVWMYKYNVRRRATTTN